MPKPSPSPFGGRGFNYDFMRKISKAVKRAIEVRATLTTTRREYTPRRRLSTGPAVGKIIDRSPWKQRNRNEAHMEKEQLKFPSL